jgi:hypothetical protein
MTASSSGVIHRPRATVYEQRIGYIERPQWVAGLRQVEFAAVDLPVNLGVMVFG